MDVLTKYALQKYDLSEVVWEIRASPLGGRGLFATRDIPAGEVIFQEPPLVLGSRSERKCASICVGCHGCYPPAQLFGCSARCGLPVCSTKCESSPIHARECRLLRERWKNGATWTGFLLSAVTPLRCLFLDATERRILEELERHESTAHDVTVNILRKSMDGQLKEDEANTAKLGCQVLDAVAFETPCQHGVVTLGGSLRGIYPLAGLMNHDCSPNTTHVFAEKNRMVVIASKYIEAGQEVTTTYTSLTWGNMARQHHLARTKHFQCRCARCSDPHEFGARLMALYCVKESCEGVLLPQDGTPDCRWACVMCRATIHPLKAAAIQNAVSSLVSNLNVSSPHKSCKVLRKLSVIPNSNQIAVEYKLSIAKMFGHQAGYTWTELTEEEIHLKELVCRETLMLLEILQLGECRLKGRHGSNKVGTCEPEKDAKKSQQDKRLQSLSDPIAQSSPNQPPEPPSLLVLVQRTHN